MTQYYSKTKKELVNINDMHHQHVWYAFKKLCDRLEELGICERLYGKMITNQPILKSLKS